MGEFKTRYNLKVASIFDFIRIKELQTKLKTENRILKCVASTKIFMTGPRMA